MTLTKTIVIFLLLVAIPTVVFSQVDKRKALEAKKARFEKELKQINALLFNNQKEEKSVITLIEDLDYKLSVKKNIIAITNAQANLLTREINTNQNEISDLRAQLKQLRDDYASMILKSYKSKSKQSKLMFLLSSESFAQAYKRLQYMEQYANYQKEQGEAIKVKTQKLQALNLQLTQQKEEKQQLIKENKLAKLKLEKELKNRESIMTSIRSNMSKFTAQIKQKKQEISRLDREIDRVIREAIAKSNKKAGKKNASGKFVLTPEAKRLASNFEANKGKLGWPVSRGVIKSNFGKQRSSIDKSIFVNNSGIKIATEKNADVKAVFNGEVSAIQKIKNANPVVMIRHGDYLSIYTNLSEIKVKKGDKVTTGQVIGKVFTNKTSGETLLGFRVYKNDQKLNPSYWLTRN